MAGNEHPFVALARRAIRHYLATGELLAPDPELNDPPPHGVFVSLHHPAGPGEDEGLLRGCVGSYVPREPTVRDEIARSAVAAAVTDPRFSPLQPGEIDDLDITVYLLEPPEPVTDISGLDPERFGVIVRGPGGRTGLLLPAIPGITSAGQQVDIARRKAGCSPGDPIDLYRFEATIIR